MCATGAFSTTCVVYVEDCVVWCLPSSCGSVVKTLAAQARDPGFPLAFLSILSTLTRVSSNIHSILFVRRIFHTCTDIVVFIC